MKTILVALTLATLTIVLAPAAEADTCMASDPTVHAVECEWLWACGNSGGKALVPDVKCYAAGPKLPPPE